MASSGGLDNLMRHAQKMQKEMSRLQRELKERVVEAGVEDGLIVVQANGNQEILAVKMKPAARELSAEDLEDLLLTALNHAMRQAKDLAKEEMARITGSSKISLPGLF